MRSCPACGARIQWLSDECGACGARFRIRMPWYVWLLGGVMVLLLIFGLGDPWAIVEVFQRLWASWQG